MWGHGKDTQNEKQKTKKKCLWGTRVSLANLADRYEAALVGFEEDHEGVSVANLNHPVLRRRLPRWLVHLPAKGAMDQTKNENKTKRTQYRSDTTRRCGQ